MNRGFPLLVCAAMTACAQIAGVGTATFSSTAASTDAHEDAPRDAATGTGQNDASPDVLVLPSEDCPSCGGGACCSPRQCAAGGSVCCASRAGPCGRNSDCCEGFCDVDAGLCSGPCLSDGAGPCVYGTDCCGGMCNSAGLCRACAKSNGGCTSNDDCCFGLECTSSEAGVCLAL